MLEEVNMIKTMMHTCIEKKHKNYILSTGKFRKNNIFLIQSGIGKVSASISTMILINLYKPDIIINSGSAGSLNSLLKIGDIVLPKEICYYDVDLTNFGYAIGQVPRYPKKFIVNKNIFSFFKKKYIQNNLKFTTGLIISGDKFIRGGLLIKKLKKNFSSAIAVEMESAAIAQVCYQFKIPLFIVKSISDLSDQNATVNFNKNISIASLQSARFLKTIIENINDLE